jgi:glycosyltransferase involved in cell wall biosynthesis
MKHFVFYFSDFSGGGAESVFIRIANQMVIRNKLVTIIVDRAEGELLRMVDPAIEILPLNSSNIIKKIFLIKKLLIKLPYERFYSTLNQPNLISFIASCIARKRKKHFARVAAVHSLSMSNSSSYKRKSILYILSLTYRYFGNIVSVSEAVSFDLVKNYKVENSKIKKIYNPCKWIMHTQDKFQKSGINAPYSILVVGRLVAQKNVDLIIDSFSQFVKIHENAELIILGDGPELSKLQRLVEQYQLIDKVDFRGFVYDPSVYYQRADLFILFSNWEGLPNVVLDALSFDLQIIVSDAPGGSGELVDYGKFGFICPVKNVESLTETIVKAKKYPLVNSKISKSIFLEQFDITAITLLYEGQDL